MVEIEAERVVNMFRNTSGKKLKALKEDDYRKLLLLLNTAGSKGLVKSLGVMFEGELCASACFFDDGKRLMYFKSSSLESGRQVRAMHFLLDHCVRTYASRDMEFDFVGSVIPSIKSFFKSFGAQDHFYHHIRKNNLPWYIKWFKN